MTRPSFKSGYAECAARSRNPHLWRNLKHAWVTSLGNTGNVLRDIAGTAHGTLTDMVAADDWIISRDVGLVLDFDGNNDRVDTGINPAGTGDCTLLGWVCPDVSSGQRMFLGNGNSNRFYLEMFNGVYHWGFGANNNSGSSTATVTANVWTHYAVRKTGVSSGNVDQFLDGKLDESGVSWSGSHAGTVNIGEYGASGLNWNGKIHSVLWYDRCLTDCEIFELYQDPLAPFHLKRRTVAKSVVVPPTGNPWYYAANTKAVVG